MVALTLCSSTPTLLSATRPQVASLPLAAVVPPRVIAMPRRGSRSGAVARRPGQRPRPRGAVVPASNKTTVRMSPRAFAATVTGAIPPTVASARAALPVAMPAMPTHMAHQVPRTPLVMLQSGARVPQISTLHGVPSTALSAAPTAGISVNQMVSKPFARMPVTIQTEVAGGMPLHVLCYGDSLTVGYNNLGASFTPYGTALASTLTSFKIPCDVSLCGLCGKTAEEMVQKADAQGWGDIAGHVGKGLARILGDADDVDLVIIMTGTNDLGFTARSQGARTAASGIFANVKALHGLCHQRGIPTVCLVPPFKLDHEGRPTQRVLAGLLAEWARGEPNVMACLDVEELVPHTPGSQHWDPDDIHISASGQRLLGEQIAVKLEDLLLDLCESDDMRFVDGAVGFGTGSPKRARSEGPSRTRMKSPSPMRPDRRASVSPRAVRAQVEASPLRCRSGSPLTTGPATYENSPARSPALSRSIQAPPAHNFPEPLRARTAVERYESSPARSRPLQRNLQSPSPQNVPEPLRARTAFERPPASTRGVLHPSPRASSPQAAQEATFVQVATVPEIQRGRPSASP